MLNLRGRPGRVVDLLLNGDLTALVDDRILAEYREVLRRPLFGFAAEDVEAVLTFLEMESEPVLARPLPALPDAGDQPFLEVASAGAADSLVTGNPRHFPARQRPAGLRVESPAEFVRRALTEEP